ncbi:MAG: cation-transporting P-type ATPase [Candidatus Krumholzibacteriales bacterium]
MSLRLNEESRPEKPNDGSAEKWWSLSAGDVLDKLEVSPGRGVPQEELSGRRARYGPNRFREYRGRSGIRILLDQFKSLVILILGVAGILSFIFGQIVEGVAVMVAVALNAVIGFFTELRAARSMDALRKLSRVEARVLRGGEQKTVPADELVAGDIVILEGGDMISADMRLFEANKFQVDESTLTGESEPVTKTVDAAAADAPLAERTSMVFKGTFVTRGSGRGVVTDTGEDTELGRISRLTAEAGGEETPLEKRLEQLGRSLIWVTVGLTAAVTVIGIFRGNEMLLMLKSGVALAVAAIPEGLPVVATVALARGMMRMASRNALINRLSSVETLGATGVIFTDKTGTLTENRMNVERLVMSSGTLEVELSDDRSEATYLRDKEEISPESDPVLRKMLETAVFCNNASLPEEGEEPEPGSGLGDPVEIALLELAVRSGMDYRRLHKDYPEEREESFDPESKMMATFNRNQARWMVSVKGAPDRILKLCSRILAGSGTVEFGESDRGDWMEKNRKLAAEGYRLLALAHKEVSGLDEDPYRELVLLGLAAFRDPPRRDMDKTMEACRGAGIRVIMVTGDQEETARHVARAVNLTGKEDVRVLYGLDLQDPELASEDQRREWLEGDVFARVTPGQKLDLIDLHQKDGAIVAMTGDGVNDAPALKEADIGVAMGLRGTQVAREASDMILKDDAFSTILVAIEQGRAIFKNIRKFILYLLSGNVSEIMIVAAALLLGMPLPILPLQILFLNLVLDVFPALALGVSEGKQGEMQNPPRPPGEPVVGRKHWLWITGYAAIIAVTVLGSFVIAGRVMGLSGIPRVTVSFLTLSLGRLWHVFNMRDGDSAFLDNPVVKNRFVWGAIGLCLILIMSVVYIPGLREVMGTSPPEPAHWYLIAAISLVPFAAGQAMKFLGADRL